MEHRWSQRKSIRANAVIFCRNLPILCGQSCNISRGGLFVETGRTGLYENSLLEVELVYENYHLHLPAVLVHQSNEGIGLMFSDIQPATRNHLNNLLTPTERPRISMKS